MTSVTEPFKRLEIASEIGGVIAKVHVEEGDQVAEGQVLVELKAGVPRAQMAVDRAHVESARLQIIAYQATFQTRKMAYERALSLFENKVLSSEDYDKAQLEMELAGVGVENAIAQKRVAELAVIRDEESLKQTIIPPPCAGEIFRILKRPGEAVEEQRPVLTLVVLDPLYIIAYAPIHTFGQIQVGMKATFLMENMADTPLECTVAVVDRVADAASGTYRVKLTLTNPARRLPAGSKGTVRFKLARKGSVPERVRGHRSAP